MISGADRLFSRSDSEFNAAEVNIIPITGLTFGGGCIIVMADLGLESKFVGVE